MFRATATTARHATIATPRVKSSVHKTAQLLVLMVLLMPVFLSAQNIDKPNRLDGTVSFVTSENVYLKFTSTEKLMLNDTIYLVKGTRFLPCLVLVQKSSVSSMAQIIGGCEVKKGDAVAYFYADAPPVEEVAPVVTDTTTVVAVVPPKKNTPQQKTADPVIGSVSLANYTTLGQNEANSRTMARLALAAKNISGSNFSVRTYAHYRQNNVSRESGTTVDRRLNVFELAVDYDLDSSFRITAGRFISRKMPSVGAMDGVMLDKNWNRFYAGGMAGMRPDPFSYKLNVSLLQLGAFAGVYHTKSKSSFTNLGFMNQNNAGATDRRYLFLQHSSTLGKKLNLFASSELDLYKTDTLGQAQNGAKLTSLFISANYRVSSKVSLSASYDVRKNVILYQSYADVLPQMLAYDPTRSGFRFNLAINASKNIRTGANVALRTQSDQTNHYYMGTVFFNVSHLKSSRTV